MTGAIGKVLFFEGLTQTFTMLVEWENRAKNFTPDSRELGPENMKH